MRMADRVLSWVVLAPVAPIALMLAGWWGSLSAQGDASSIKNLALGGFALGVLLDASLLRRWIGSLLSMTDRALLAVAVFYSIGIYGFFMGLPIFNVVVALVGGCVVARRAQEMGWSRQRAVRDGRRVAIAMTWILGALCAATAWMALREPTIASQVQGMLRLPFPVTQPMIYAIIVTGGLGLLAFQYAATLLVAKWFAPR